MLVKDSECFSNHPDPDSYRDSTSKNYRPSLLERGNEGES